MSHIEYLQNDFFVSYRLQRLNLKLVFKYILLDVNFDRLHRAGRL